MQAALKSLALAVTLTLTLSTTVAAETSPLTYTTVLSSSPGVTGDSTLESDYLLLSWALTSKEPTLESLLLLKEESDPLRKSKEENLAGLSILTSYDRTSLSVVADIRKNLSLPSLTLLTASSTLRDWHSYENKAFFVYAYIYSLWLENPSLFPANYPLLDTKIEINAPTGSYHSLIEELFPEEQYENVYAIIACESNGNPDVLYGPNTDGTYDYGLFQINSTHHAGQMDEALKIMTDREREIVAAVGYPAALYDPLVNTYMAYYITETESWRATVASFPQWRKQKWGSWTCAKPSKTGAYWAY